MSDEKFRESVTSQLMSAAFSGPAPGSNKFVITVGATGVRIAFLEEAPRTEGSDQSYHFRSAVTMNPQDGVKLYKILADMLSDLESAIEAAEMKPEAKLTGNG